MSWNDYITLDGKKYKVVDRGEGSYQQIHDRQKTYDVGLTGKTIAQDFTVSSREPHPWKFMLRVFISDPWPDSSWGEWSDLLEAYRDPSVSMTYFDGTTQWNVGIQSPLIPIPRVGANVEGLCNGIVYAEVNLVEIYA